MTSRLHRERDFNRKEKTKKSEESRQTPEELFAALAAEFLASGLEIDEFIKKKLCEEYPDDDEKCAETLTDTFAEIDSNHESLRKAKEDGYTRKGWLDLRLGEIVKTVAGVSCSTVRYRL